MTTRFRLFERVSTVERHGEPTDRRRPAKRQVYEQTGHDGAHEIGAAEPGRSRAIGSTTFVRERDR